MMSSKGNVLAAINREHVDCMPSFRSPEIRAVDNQWVGDDAARRRRYAPTPRTIIRSSLDPQDDGRVTYIALPRISFWSTWLWQCRSSSAHWQSRVTV